MNTFLLNANKMQVLILNRNKYPSQRYEQNLNNAVEVNMEGSNLLHACKKKMLQNAPT